MRLARFTLPLILLFCGWQQPVPTHVIHITGDPGATVQISISDELPDGTVAQSEWRLRTPGHVTVNADHHLRLKIESETPVTARHFYEYQDVKEQLATMTGTLIEFDIPAR